MTKTKLALFTSIAALLAFVVAACGPQADTSITTDPDSNIEMKCVKGTLYVRAGGYDFTQHMNVETGKPEPCRTMSEVALEPKSFN